MSLRSLLCSAEPTDPQDAEVAKHYMSDRAGFEQTARYWTEIYANGSESARPPPTTSAGSGASNAEERTDAALLAGLKPEHVEQFAGMVSGAESARSRVRM